MNNKEATLLCRYVRALCPQQKFDEYTADAWYEILRDYQLADAREAASRVGRRQPFVAPAEIADEIRVIRGERLENFVYEPQPDDDNPRAYLANTRAQRAAVADGRRPADPGEHLALPAGQARDVTPALALVGRPVPNPNEPQPKRGALGVVCPKCSARIGRHCRWPGGGKRPTHPDRVRSAEGTAPDPRAEQDAADRRAAAAAYLAQLDDTQRQQLAEFQQQLTKEDA